MTTAEPRTFPRFLGCLIKGPAGCLAFFLGAGVVFVLLLPAAGGRVIDNVLESGFEERFAGQLELGDAWLGSFYGPQRVERVILRDPAGDEVLRGSLTGPFLTWGLQGSRYRYGPVRLELELLRVIADEDGVTNLERAFEHQPSWSEEPRRGSGLTTDTPLELELEVFVARLRYTTERGRESLLEDLRFRGRLVWGPSRTHLLLEGGNEVPAPGQRFRLRVECERAEDGLDRPFDVALALESAPTVLARALCAALRPVSAPLGAQLDALQWTRKRSAVALVARDAGAHLAFQGMDLDGLVSGTAEAPLQLALPCGEPLGRALVERLLPPLASLVCDDPAQPHVVRLHAFRWPLDGDWSELEGELELALAPGRATLAPLGAAPAALVALLGPPSARLPLRAGVLEYAGLQLPLEDGWLRLDGTLELASGLRTLGVVGESAGQALERVELVGEAPEVPSLPRPPEFPPLDGPAVPALPPQPQH